MKASIVVLGILVMLIAVILNLTVFGLLLELPIGVIGFLIFLIGLAMHGRHHGSRKDVVIKSSVQPKEHGRRWHRG